MVPATETCLSARAWLKNCLMSGGTAFTFLEGKGTKWHHLTIPSHPPAPLCDPGLTGASTCFWRGPGGPGWRSILGPAPQRAVRCGEEKHHSNRAHNPKMDQKGQGAEPHGSGFGLTVSREQSVAARLRCVSEAQRPRRLCKLCRREGLITGTTPPTPQTPAALPHAHGGVLQRQAAGVPREVQVPERGADGFVGRERLAQRAHPCTGRGGEGFWAAARPRRGSHGPSRSPAWMYL